MFKVDRMKSLNAKRIAAVVAGAALLGVGLAFAGPVTFQNIPIISNSGQPLVQIVIGATAAPSDGAAAANIAAAIGNLAYTSVPVTASISASQALGVLHVSVVSPHYALSNAQVWLNETGSVGGGSASSYPFYALIGSVINRAILQSSPINTKGLQASTSYGYPVGTSLQSSTPISPYSGVSSVPAQTVSGATNGGGVQFSTFRNGTTDNILRIDSSELPALMNNAGANGENEFLWVTGFPVYDQATAYKTFALVGAGGAYQVTFNKPIPKYTGSSGNTLNQPQIELLGQEWTILNYTTPPNSGRVGSTNVTFGGSLQLAESLSNMTTVYVGHNITSGLFTVQLQDLGQANANSLYPAIIQVYYNGVATNQSVIVPGAPASRFNDSGHILYVKVNNTAAGLYGYQKWAKMQLYSNVFNITSGKVWNATYDNGWEAFLGWTNSTSSSGHYPNALQQIIAYNTSPITLVAGQSLNFIQDPASFKLTFVGDTLGASNFDAVTAATTSTTSLEYQNTGIASNITEPAQELVVTSQIPDAFSYGAQTSSQVLYDLTPYQLTGSAGSNSFLAGNNDTYINYEVAGSGEGNLINTNDPLTITVKGAAGAGQPTTAGNATIISSAIGTTFASHILTPGPKGGMYNVTGIGLSEAVPGLTVVVTANEPIGTAGNSVIATLSPEAPQVMYSESGKPYYLTATAANVLYNQQNGQPTTDFNLAAVGAPNLAAGTVAQYFTYTMNEIAVTGQSTQDALAFGLVNSTAGDPAMGSTLFQLNYSANTGSFTHGNPNNMTYEPSGLSSFSSPLTTSTNAGFRTERGSKIASITPTSVTVDFAKSPDTLEFVAATSNTVAPTKSFKVYGPYGIGQATNIANVSVYNVNATISLSGTSSYNITGISNIIATPSIASADQPVLLSNLASQPLVAVAGTSAVNSGSSLILVGSGYVNALSQQLQTLYNVSIDSPSSAVVAQAYGTNRILVAGYTANQTTQASNNFIQALYTAASSS
jgi:hypothetical protein